MSVAERRAGLAERRAGLAERTISVAERRALLAERTISVAERRAGLAERRAGLAERRAGLAEPGRGLAEPGRGGAEARHPVYAPAGVGSFFAAGAAFFEAVFGPSTWRVAGPARAAGSPSSARPDETLTVLRWTPDGYLTALTAGRVDRVHAELFDAIESPGGALFGDEE